MPRGRGRTRVEASIAPTSTDAGYLGLFGQTVFAVRAVRRDADQPLPLYTKPMLGGMGSVRGFKAGTAIGDTLVTGSAELIVPIGPALSIGKFGVSAFADTGTVYDKGASIRKQVFKQGYGVGVWVTAAFFRFNVAVAHGKHATTRVHIGGTSRSRSALTCRVTSSCPVL